MAMRTPGGPALMKAYKSYADPALWHPCFGARSSPGPAAVETTGVAQHVRVDVNGILASLPSLPIMRPDGTHGRSALTHEKVAPWFLFPLQTAERAKLGACKRMQPGCAWRWAIRIPGKGTEGLCDNGRQSCDANKPITSS
jgi:hypothetical protein